MLEIFGIISIIVTVNSIKQDDCSDENEHQKSNRPDQG